MKKLNLLSALLCSLAIFFAMTCIASAETLPDYDAEATLEYAEQHWDDGKEADGSTEDCTEFSRSCVQAGGVPKDTDRVRKNGTGYTVEDYIDYMIDSGYAELYQLETEKVTFSSGTYYYVPEVENAGKVAPGDIIIYKCTNKNCDRTYFHASICAPADESGTYGGYYRYYAHRSAVGNKPLLTLNCSKCKQGKEKTELYALHITSKDNGYSAYDEKVTAKAKCKDYNTIKITWDAVDGASSYHVFYKKSSKSFMEKLTTVSKTSTEFTVPKDYYAATLYFAVRPCAEIDGKHYVGGLSNQTSAYTVADAPKNVNLTLTDYRSVKVSWDKAKGATGYIVEYQPKGSSKWSHLCRTTKTSATRKNLTAGKKYTFRITPYTTSAKYTGERKSTNSATNSVYTLKRLSKPTMKRTSTAKVKVSWTNISGETGYQISKSTSKSKTGTITTVKSTSAKSKTISAKKGKKYYYKVRAYKVVNGKKVCGPWSTTTYF